jgi:arginine deiminase
MSIAIHRCDRLSRVDGLDRREVLRLLAASAASSMLWRPASAATTTAAPPKHFVSSDVAKLRRVIVCPPSKLEYGISRLDEDLIPLDDTDTDALQAEHAALTRILRSSGAQVLSVPELLESAIAKARSRGVWETWLGVAYPNLAADPQQVTADTLLGRDPKIQFRTWPDGSYRHIDNSVSGMIFSRDAAAMLPNGIALLNLGSPHRVAEQVLTRFMFDFAPELAHYPIIFDARQEGLRAEGGDFQVIDDHTLFLGVGNRTDPRIAPILARRVNMDVLAVQTRKTDWLRRVEKPSQIRSVFLHLDTYCTHVADKQILTLPWFLEAQQSGKDPYSEFLQGFGDGSISDEDLKTGAEFMKEFGLVRLFRAGTGEEDLSPKGMKLVDYVRSRGYSVHFVGGDPPTTDLIRHLFAVVLEEHHRQAANVVATSPGRVVAYEGAPLTHAALRRSGIEVTTFPARELWPFDGGPHCLTMPLERG